MINEAAVTGQRRLQTGARRRRHGSDSVSSLLKPPPGQSRTLAAWQADQRRLRRDRWPSLALFLAIFAGFPLFGRSSDLVDWLLALGLGFGTWLLIDAGGRRDAIWVGRDWLCRGLAWGNKWVRTDQLVHLEWAIDGCISMRDRDGRKLVVKPDELQRNPRVHRIFVEAVERSVDSGLVVGGPLREELGLGSDDG